jgi:ankyrin repeat protein
VLHLIFEGQLSRMRHMSEQHSEDAVPMHLRSSLKNCLRLFGARGANVEQRDVIGNLPLAYALVFNHFTLVPTLLDMSTPKNLDLLAPVCYTHVQPVKPECQESDYDEYVHGSEKPREPGDNMSAEDRAKLKQVNGWLAAMKKYRRRERSLSSFRQYVGESAIHFFVKNGKLELVRMHPSRCRHHHRHTTCG